MNSQQLVKSLQQQSIVINRMVITVDQLRTAFNIEVRKPDEHTSLLYLNKTVNVGEVLLIGGIQEDDLEEMIPKLQYISNRLRTCIDLNDALGIYNIINDSNYIDFLIHDDIKSLLSQYILIILMEQRVKLFKNIVFSLSQYINNLDSIHEKNSYIFVCEQQVLPLSNVYNDGYPDIKQKISKLYHYYVSGQTLELIQYINSTAVFNFEQSEYMKTFMKYLD